MESDWLSFPDEVWEEILDYLELKSLLATTETCSKLNNLISESPRIMKKLTLNIDERQRDGKKLAIRNQVLKSQRKYKNIVISHPFRDKRTREQIIQILILFSKSVQELTFMVDNSFSRKEIAEILKPCNKLRKCTFDYIYFEKDDDDELESPQLPSMEELIISIEEPKLYSILSCCNKLKKLHLSGYTYSNSENPGNGLLLEEFLAKQQHLIDFTIIKKCTYRMFSTNLLSQCKFNLLRLELKGEIFFVDSDNALQFFKTQTQLIEVDIYLDQEWNGNHTTKDILKHIFMNKDLQKMSIMSAGYYINSLDFLNNVINPKVEVLKCESLFVPAFAKIFPNVKDLNYTGFKTEDENVRMINEFKYLETLEIYIMNTKSLKHIQLTSQTFHTFIYDNMIHKFNLDFEIFLKRHSSIRSLNLPIKLSYGEIKKICGFCPNIETFTFDHCNNEMDLSIQHLCLNLKKLKSIVISSYYTLKLSSEVKAFCDSSSVSIIYNNDY